MRERAVDDGRRKDAVMAMERSILVVDDERTMREFLETSLRGRYHVRTAANGTEALYDRAQEDFEAYWLDQALNRVTWFKEPTQGLDASEAPFFTWFADGELNITHNCLDRHIANGGGESASASMSSVQYSFGTNFWISRSRSQMIRSATLCTRPADRPRRTFSHSRGLSL